MPVDIKDPTDTLQVLFENSFVATLDLMEKGVVLTPRDFWVLSVLCGHIEALLL